MTSPTKKAPSKRVKTIGMVCGFIFSVSRSEVLLVRKARPDFQKGLLNGFGGKIERVSPRRWETPEQAIAREFKEEIKGIRVGQWHPFATLVGNTQLYEGMPVGHEFIVHFFYGDTPDSLSRAKSKVKDERLEIVTPSALFGKSPVPNLMWLIPMALSMRRERAASFTVQENYPVG